MAAGVGVEMEYIDATEVRRRHPLLGTDGLLGAWWDPLDGDIDPAQLVFSLARCARNAGCEIYRFNPVENITRKHNGEFIVHTKNGDIHCEIVVNASGYRVNEVGSMLGVVHPVVSLEHMYFLTEPIEEIAQLDFRVPIIRDPRDNFYSRQEKTGLLVGVYEHDCRLFGIDGIDPEFTKSLCPSDLDRCLDNMERIFRRLPCLTETGIHTVINGPITYSADGAPLVGAVPGLQNVFACLGLRAGIGEGGGLGKVLAQIMVYGECEWDAWYLDPRRLTHWATTDATRLKAVEEYQREFDYHLPHEFRPAARLARSTPLYDELDKQDCHWGVINGWERVLFFKPSPDFEDQLSYRFTPTHEVVENEINGIVNAVGLMEVSGFNRYEIRGPGAGEFLERMSCSAIPKQTGKVNLCYLLTERGHLLSEATIAQLGKEHYWYGSAAAAEWHDRDWLCQNLPPTVTLEEVTTSYTTLVLAGPRSKNLLRSLAPRENWSNEAFSTLRAKRIEIGNVDVLVMRLSYSGELAYELHVANEHLVFIYGLLKDTGTKFGLIQFGSYASESMRLEKGYLHWKADLIYERNPMEAGLERFVKMEKSTFIGRDALQKEIQRGERKRLVVMTVNCKNAPAHMGDPIYFNGHQVGTVTSAGYGHRVQKNIAYAYVDSSVLKEKTLNLQVGILGEIYPVELTARCMYDPQNLKVKA